ncbi:TPA: gamma-glutamyltransferase [Pseudomonas aeruginosa]
MRNLHLPGRSPVRAQRGMISTSHPLASQAGLDILRRGGSAMDAAVAAAAVLAVVEPQATGIGGDCFVLLAGKDQKVRAFNGSGRSPKAATLDWYLQQGLDAIPGRGAHSVTVPGAIDAWCQLLDEHGVLAREEVFKDAIFFAREGYVVADRVAGDWAQNEPWLKEIDNARRVFLPEGRAPKAGEIHRQPELANTLEAIAKFGRDAFYTGAIAEDMAEALQAGGGLHTLADFAECRGNYVDPIKGSYRGFDLYQVPPNNQGLTALLMLNTLSHFDLKELHPESAARLHLEVEASRLAYRERDLRLADQASMNTSVEQLLAPEVGEKMARGINLKATGELPDSVLDHSDTVYLCVVDENRNVVSFINSIYNEFGSGVVAPKSGVLLQNRGKSFRLSPEHPNVIAPTKRPMHTIMPGMLCKDGQVIAPLGVMGGDYQPVGQVHVLTNIIDYGMDAQEAIDAPRVFFENGVVQVEAGVSADTRLGLEALGHKLVDSPSYKPLGGGQIILIDPQTGTLTAGSDPRKDGSAIGY